MRRSVLVLLAFGLVAASAAIAAAAKLKSELTACAEAKGWSFEGRAPGQPSHFAASALAFCHLTLPPELLCEPRARASLIESLRAYFAQRDDAMRYLRQVDAYRARQRKITSSIDAEQRTAVEREAQSWVGDEDITDGLIKLVKAGYFKADDFLGAAVHADVVHPVGNCGDHEGERQTGGKGQQDDRRRAPGAHGGGQAGEAARRCRLR